MNHADNEITKNVLEDLIHLYIKNRTFSLVRSKMDAHKLLLRKNKARSLSEESKNHVTLQQTTETSLEEYLKATVKNSYFYSYK